MACGTAAGADLLIHLAGFDPAAADRGIERRGGATDYAWFVFPKEYQGPTTVIRLPPRGL